MHPESVDHQILYVNDDPFEKVDTVEQWWSVIFVYDGVDDTSLNKVLEINQPWTRCFPGVKEGVNWDMFKKGESGIQRTCDSDGTRVWYRPRKDVTPILQCRLHRCKGLGHDAGNDHQANQTQEEGHVEVTPEYAWKSYRTGVKFMHFQHLSWFKHIRMSVYQTSWARPVWNWIKGFVCFQYMAIEVESPLYKYVVSYIHKVWEQSIFPGPQPISIERKHFPILKGGEYVVCEKTDGERHMLVALMFEGKKKCVFVNRSFKCQVPINLKKSAYDGTILDGELYENVLMVYSGCIVCSEMVWNLDLHKRMDACKGMMKSMICENR